MESEAYSLNFFTLIKFNFEQKLKISLAMIWKILILWMFSRKINRLFMIADASPLIIL